MQVLVASMAEPETSADPELAREYSKLFTAASKSREVHLELRMLLRDNDPAGCSQAVLRQCWLYGSMLCSFLARGSSLSWMCMASGRYCAGSWPQTTPSPSAR